MKVWASLYCITGVWCRNPLASADPTWRIAIAQPATCELLQCELAGSGGQRKSRDESLCSSAVPYTYGFTFSAPELTEVELTGLWCRYSC